MAPRSATRQRNATPARSTRATSATAQETSATRRTTRGTTRGATQASNAISNPALPEIQTQQSYAYGASKAPALPEQLQARDLSMGAVADRMKSAIESAEKNFEAHAADTRGYTPESQVSTRNTRSRKKASVEPSPQSNTPEQVRKTQRTAAWVESSQLDDITEESSNQSTPQGQRHGSEPSSFPSGIFDHSYNYERGLRGPRLTQHADWRERLRRARSEISITAKSWTAQTLSWISRMTQAIQNSLAELPESEAFLIMVKIVIVTAAISFCGVLFCAIWSRSCVPDSPSLVSQSFSKLCGRCTNDMSGLSALNMNISSGGIESFNKALNARYQQLQQQIQKVENRLNSKLDSKQVSHAQEIESLRRQQHAIELQLRRLAGRGTQDQASSCAVASPLIPKINFFSPANGALIDPYSTSPTRQKPMWLPTRIALNVLGIHKYSAHPPVTALTPWQDVGDCWCAAETKGDTDQDKLRLAISVRELMYPTELVIEHIPASGSLVPETAPRDIELWADFSHLSSTDFHQRLRIPDLQQQAVAHDKASASSPFSSNSAWARIGTATYGASVAAPDDDVYGGTDTASHVQTFSLDVNQNGNLHHAQSFMLRVTKNHGADYTCLYRVRLHGVPVKGAASDE